MDGKTPSEPSAPRVHVRSGRLPTPIISAIAPSLPPASVRKQPDRVVWGSGWHSSGCLSSSCLSSKAYIAASQRSDSQQLPSFIFTVAISHSIALATRVPPLSAVIDSQLGLLFAQQASFQCAAMLKFKARLPQLGMEQFDCAAVAHISQLSTQHSAQLRSSLRAPVSVSRTRGCLSLQLRSSRVEKPSAHSSAQRRSSPRSGIC